MTKNIYLFTFFKRYYYAETDKEKKNIFEEMNQKEAELVDERFIIRKDTYNLKTGGSSGVPGGYGHRLHRHVYLSHGRLMLRPRLWKPVLALSIQRPISWLLGC